MSTVINIFAMKIHSIAGNGSVNIGESFHNSHTARSGPTRPGGCRQACGTGS